VTYEAQAAIELEMIATQWERARPPELPEPYPFDLQPGNDGVVIRLQALLQAIQANLAAGTGAVEIAWRFHHTMASLIVHTCRQLARESGVQTVALSGGCFQNRLLLALTVPRLERSGFDVLLHRQVPCNDGGLSLGQVALARFAQADKGEDHEIH
jgi:hydrogenase maturation protein HypF